MLDIDVSIQVLDLSKNDMQPSLKAIREFIAGLVVSDSTGRFKYKSEQLFDHFSYAQGFDVFAACISPRLLGKNNEKVGVAFPVWICNNSLFEPLFTLPIGTIGVTVDKDTGVFIYEYGRDDIVGVINQEGVPIFAQEGLELKQQEIMSFPKAMQIVMEYVTIEL